MEINVFLIIVLLLVSIFALSVSVLAKSVTDYQYNKILSYEWNVYFDNLSLVKLEGNAVEIKRPYIDYMTTKIGSFRIKFNSNGDTASYHFDVVNDSNIDAVVTSINYTEPICYTLNDGGLLDSDNVCEDFDYAITYLDGSIIKEGDIIKKNSRKTLKITMQYNGRDLPNDVVEISNITASVTYIQK